jgi:phosphotriesterase-related protein
MDRFGIERPATTAQRVETIARLCALGFTGQMVLAHDACCLIDWFPRGTVEQIMPNWNWRYIPDAVIPALRAAGASDADIHTMTIDNPRRVFERNTGPY